MKRGLLFAMFLPWMMAAHAASFWDSLWHNANQRGEQLLHQGDAAAAAQTYTDPRHKAYAELQAGDYANAAKNFSAFDDSNSNYNRGNALAEAGQLQDALKAYDAALAQDPDDRDARHNRDLVAKALQQQPPQSQSDQSNSSRDGKNSDKNSGNKNSGKQASSQNNSGKQNSPGQNSADNNQSDKDQAGKTQQAKTGQGKPGNSAGQQAGQGLQQLAQNKQSATQPQGRTLADDAAQAKRDAVAALGKPPTGNSSKPSDAPVSEQQLAQQQWLRAIPDDPGGLLRRKFMIEHMIRQQGGQP